MASNKQDNINAGLTPQNLAYLGALDDFYDLYCEVEEICESIKENNYISEKYGANNFTTYFFLNYNKKEIRKTCEPVLNKYLYLFSEERPVIYATEFGFRFFRFYKEERPKGGYPGDEILKKITFSEFLAELEYAVTRIMVNSAQKKYKDDSKEIDYSEEFTRQSRKIHYRIKELTKSKIKEFTPTGLEHMPCTKSPLYVFDRLSSVLCNKDNHIVVPTKYVADLLNGKKIILPVHYCYFCDKYFIGKITLSLFEKSQGKIIAEKKLLAPNSSFQDFNTESKLHQMGYNVIEGVLTENERHKILINLLENKKISYLEICSTIEQNIKLFENSYQHRSAVKKWKDDLKFIGEYIKG